MSIHKSSLIPVKNGTAIVDLGIQPIVNWLNNFPSISTLSSCQGGLPEKSDAKDDYALERLAKEYGSPLPYVSFLSDSVDLKSVMKFLAEHGVLIRTCGRFSF